ncbi:MAG: hypothetical protein JWN77_1595, partial [Frankiales bacterium]|nr:hypothetical protein [Frankiales bacterium]
MRFRSTHASRFAAVLCLALLTGCGPKTQLDLDLRSVSITVPRLVTPAVQLVPPATTPQPAPLPPTPPLVTVLAAVPDAPPALPTGPQPVPAPPVPACPKAGPLDVPARPAALSVELPPAAATYPQTSTGSFAGAAGTPSSGALNAPVTTVVKRLPRVVSSAGQAIDGYQVVRTDTLHKSTSVEAYQLVHASTAPTATAGGIYLVGLGWRDPVRGDLTFEPTGNGLQVLPLPVAVAQSGTVQYVGTATDPSTLTTLTLTRNVSGRKRVDV